jgi:hypothetical protein
MTNREVEAAVDAVNAKRATRPKPIVLNEAKVRIAEKALRIKASGELAFTRGKDADPALAHLLVFDEKLGAYVAVLTPPGTSWELVEKRQGTGIWTPGLPT